MTEEQDKDKERKNMQPTPPVSPPTVPAPILPPTPMTSGVTQGDATEKGEPSIAPDADNVKTPPPLIGLRPILPQTPGVRSFQAGILKNAWKCPNGHILGIVLQEQRGGSKITRLGMLPFAFEPHEFIPENILISKIDAGEIACSRCGLVRIWHPGEWMTASFVARLGTHRRSS